MSFYTKVRPILFKLDPERAHKLVKNILNTVKRFPLIESSIFKINAQVFESLEQNIFNLNFYNPVGIASGFDKNAQMIRALAMSGFGFLELGSITNDPQDGNEKPRLFRHIQERSIQNAMGFDNIGARGVVENLKDGYPFVVPIGINIGKNKFVAVGDSLKNYELCLRSLESYGDYFVFNLSSPNTPGLRDLQNDIFVKDLLEMARAITNKPLLIKISPDMEMDSMLRVCSVAVDCGASGIIATNTTIDYSLITNPHKRDGSYFGGISGDALKIKSRNVLKTLCREFLGKTVIISVGGIDSAQEAYTRIKLGANLVQIFTSVVYEGLGIIRNINKDLDRMLKSEGFTHVSQAIGIDTK